MPYSGGEAHMGTLEELEELLDGLFKPRTGREGVAPQPHVNRNQMVVENNQWVQPRRRAAKPGDEF